MALNQEQKNELTKSALIFLYAFFPTSYEQYLGKYKTIILTKRDRARQAILNAAGGSQNYQEALNVVSAKILSVYGLTPANIIAKLMKGETVAGKNWSQGIFGIGATEANLMPTTVWQDSGTPYYCDINTGKILDGAKKEFKGQTPIYTNGKITGYSYYDKSTNKTFITAYSDKFKTEGKFTAYTYSDGAGILYAAYDGAKTTPEKATFWENNYSSLPILQKLLDWILSLFKIKSDTTPEKIAPNQINDGFATQSAGFDFSTIAMVGGAAIVATLAYSAFKGQGKGEKNKRTVKSHKRKKSNIEPSSISGLFN